MKNLILCTSAALAGFLSVLPSPAQTYTIRWHSIGPAGASASGSYSVSGSIGQLDAGNMSGGNVSLSGGFWVAASVPPGVETQYTIIDLGTLSGSAPVPNAVNNGGQIVGYANTNSSGNLYPLAVFWPNSSSGALGLGVLGGDYASAIGINDSGQIVGDAYLTGDFVYHAAIWTNSDHAPLDLGSLGGWSVAASIDRVGNIAGYSSTPTNWTFALYWTNATSPPLQLGTLGGVHNQAHSVNDSGQIVGASTPGGSQYTHAVIWSNVTSAPVDLGTVGLDQSFAQAINNSGQIAGWASGSGQTIPLYWANSSSAPVGLAFLGNNSEALGINASGRIVGYSSVGLNGPSHAVLWNNGGSAAIDLNTLILVSSGWELTSANAINDSGEIVGSGLVGGQPHAFALIPSAVALRITSVARVGAVLQLSFTTQAGHMYNVLGTSDLVTGVWTPVETGIAGNGATIQVTIPNQFGQPRQFYRIQQSQ